MPRHTSQKVARSRRSRRANDWNRMGAEAARIGDHSSAEMYFTKAVAADRKNPSYRLNFALSLSRTGRMDEAAAALTQALRLQPANREAAHRLSRLLSTYQVLDFTSLDPFGLKAALGFDTIDRQPVVEAAFQYLRVASKLGDLLAIARTKSPEAAAEKILAKRPSDLLRMDLFSTALKNGVNKDPNIELLLAGVRRFMLLSLDSDRFREPSICSFATALIAQCRANEYVYSCPDDEADTLSKLELDLGEFLGGDFAATRAFFLHTLYREPESLHDVEGRKGLEGIRPRILRDAVHSWQAERRNEQRFEQDIARYGEISDATSLRVRQQYEQNPYPRWSSIQVTTAGAIRKSLEPYFGTDRLAFMDSPFEILIAGAGTGRQVVQAAFSYGENASILAVDLSRKSLAYAQRMAEHYGISNIEFLQADIVDLAGLERSFDVIECVGVLHHMADPYEAWACLVNCLKPSGIMYIGLYSRLSREGITCLKEEPDYPGAGCSDDKARTFRRHLICRDETEPGGLLKHSADFYTLSDFRDLVLHASEQVMVLPEIENFLKCSSLSFRGFTLHAERIREFEDRFSDDPWPGTLANWRRFEEAEPSLFEAMYCFWCGRVT